MVNNAELNVSMTLSELSAAKRLAIPNLSRYIPDGPRQVALGAFFREFVPG